MGATPLNIGHADVNYLCQSIMGVPIFASDEKITISGTHAVTSTLLAGRVYRLYSDTDCHLAVGAAPVATAANYFFPAGREYHLIMPSAMQISVIQATAGGFLYVSKLDGVNEG